MATIVYGVKTFPKRLGDFGEEVFCQYCSKSYKQAIVRVRRAGHLEYIPILPMTSKYYIQCPVCAASEEVKKKNIKDKIEEAKQSGESKLEFVVKHVLANRPTSMKDKLLAGDTSYELWAKDLTDNDEFCVQTGLSKSELKKQSRARGLKKFKVIDV